MAIITKHEAQIVGNIGMFYACYRLSRLGWNVMPTARNARGVDIIAYPRTRRISLVCRSSPSQRTHRFR